MQQTTIAPTLPTTPIHCKLCNAPMIKWESSYLTGIELILLCEATYDKHIGPAHYRYIRNNGVRSCEHFRLNNSQSYVYIEVWASRPGYTVADRTNVYLTKFKPYISRWIGNTIPTVEQIKQILLTEGTKP